MSDLTRFDYLWKESDWVVWKDPVDGGYLPFNAQGHALIIEDDELAKRVCERMIQMGRPVVTELPQLAATAHAEQKQ